MDKEKVDGFGAVIGVIVWLACAIGMAIETSLPKIVCAVQARLY